MTSLSARLAGWWGRDAHAVERQELHARALTSGCTPICDIREREVVRVTGVVRSVAQMPSSKLPTLDVELYDGTRTVRLVWLGRRRIGGIEPGARLTAQGRVAIVRDEPTIFNPEYELIAAAAGA